MNKEAIFEALRDLDSESGREFIVYISFERDEMLVRPLSTVHEEIGKCIEMSPTHFIKELSPTFSNGVSQMAAWLTSETTVTPSSVLEMAMT